MGLIFSIVDVSEALYNRRPLQAPWPLEQIAGLYRENRGALFGPCLADPFLSHDDEIVDLQDSLSDG